MREGVAYTTKKRKGRESPQLTTQFKGISQTFTKGVRRKEEMPEQEEEWLRIVSHYNYFIYCSFCCPPLSSDRNGDLTNGLWPPFCSESLSPRKTSNYRFELPSEASSSPKGKINLYEFPSSIGLVFVERRRHFLIAPLSFSSPTCFWGHWSEARVLPYSLVWCLSHDHGPKSIFFF